MDEEVSGEWVTPNSGTQGLTSLLSVSQEQQEWLQEQQNNPLLYNISRRTLLTAAFQSVAITPPTTTATIVSLLDLVTLCFLFSFSVQFFLFLSAARFSNQSPSFVN